MKKSLYAVIPVAMIAAATLFSSYGGDNTDNPSGAPAGNTNSPADGWTCNHCMGGSVGAVTGWLTSDIPATGYEPGQTYTITATATGSGNKGFQVSPQDVPGNLIGTLTAGTGNKLVGTGKYVTHNSAVASATATWTFTWTAPSAGAGDVTFYGAFWIAGTTPKTRTTTMTVSQSTVGIHENGLQAFSVYPVPAKDHVTVSFENPVSAIVSVSFLNVNGTKIATLANSEEPAGDYSRKFNISQPAGIYLMEVSAGGQKSVRKLIVQ